jgi:hypothetical protein
MNMPLPTRTQFAILCALPLSLVLSGCGGAAGDDEQEPPALSAGADYRAIVAYCKVDESRPGGGPGAGNGWVSALERLDGGVNQAATFISHDGNRSLWERPVTLAVPLFDYRSLPAKFAFAPGFNQSQSMGTAFPTLLPKSGVGCVTQLTKVAHTPPIDLSGIPGWTGSALSGMPAEPYSMKWKSYWDGSLPLGQLSGTPVDGFEFVTNFIPGSGQSFFNVEKSRFASTAGMSICYLAPQTSRWDCATPTTADHGATWQLVRSGAKPGAYVLIAPTR